MKANRFKFTKTPVYPTAIAAIVCSIFWAVQKSIGKSVPSIPTITQIHGHGLDDRYVSYDLGNSMRASLLLIFRADEDGDERLFRCWSQLTREGIGDDLIYVSLRGGVNESFFHRMQQAIPARFLMISPRDYVLLGNPVAPRAMLIRDGRISEEWEGDFSPGTIRRIAEEVKRVP